MPESPAPAIGYDVDGRPIGAWNVPAPDPVPGVEESQPRPRWTLSDGTLTRDDDGLSLGSDAAVVALVAEVRRLRAENERYALALTRITDMSMPYRDFTSAARSIARAALAESPSPGPGEQA